VSQTTADAVPLPEELVRVVALDGPAGSGKSSVSRAVAKELGWRFVDTGATYRAVTLAVLRQDVDVADVATVAEVAASAQVELGPDPDRPLVLLDGEDVTAEIRSAEVTAAVSAVSAVPAVREVLIRLQRSLMGRDGAVVEGRDIATVVAPRAAVKVYLDARPEVRARRRAAEEVTLPGSPAEAPGVHELVQQALLARDARDTKTNPLKPSEGAVHLETSELTFPEVVAEVVALVRDAGLLDEPAERQLLSAGAQEPSSDPMTGHTHEETR